MPRLVWGGGQLDLPMLQVPLRLNDAYVSCQFMLDMIEAGTIKRTKQGIEEWIKAGLTPVIRRQRRQIVDRVMDFLEGDTLENAEQKLTQHYEKFISTDPSARAALLVAAAVVRKEGATFVATDEGDELVVPLLPGWCLAGGERYGTLAGAGLPAGRGLAPSGCS